MAAVQGDSLDEFAKTQPMNGPSPANLYEPATVRDRDQPLQQFRRSAKEDIPESDFRVWPGAQANGPNKPFQPNASFQCLRDSGKLVTEEVEPQPQKRYLMPGYTGFVRGRQLISGRTFGETTARAHSTPYEEAVCTSPVPSAPQCNRKIPLDPLEDSFMHGVLQGLPYHIPGYTGHVPMANKQYARSYGEVTRQQIKTFQEQHPRKAPQEKEGYAFTSKARHYYDVDSSPVPGGCNHSAPVKLVPKNLKYLQYFAI